MGTERGYTSRIEMYPFNYNVSGYRNNWLHHVRENVGWQISQVSFVLQTKMGKRLLRRWQKIQFRLTDRRRLYYCLILAGES